MKQRVDELGRGIIKYTIEVPEKEFEEAVEKAYRISKHEFKISGYKQGKAPREAVEEAFGNDYFYKDAAGIIIPEAYEKAWKISGKQIASAPKLEVIQCEIGKSFIFTAEVALKPEVKLGQYRGIEVPANIKPALSKETESDKTKELVENYVIEKIAKSSEIELSDLMILTEERQMLDQLLYQMSRQGINVEEYLQSVEETSASIMERLRPQAEIKIRSRLCMEEIAKREHIEVNEEEYEAQLEYLAYVNETDPERLKDMLTEDERKSIINDLTVKKACDFVMDNVKW